jgi:hypothetical protein
VKVAVGNGVEVAVGLGETPACAPPGGVGVAKAAEAISAAGVLVANGEGSGCEVQALIKTRESAMKRMRGFMGAIIAEAAGCVNTTKTGAREHLAPVVFTASFKLNGQSI